MGLLIVGVLLVLAGSTFALQGADYLGGSSMTGNPFWLYAGSGIAVLGVLLIIVAVARRSRSKMSVSPASN